MRKGSALFITLILSAAHGFATQDAEQEHQAVEEQHFKPFTGKVLGNRVRLRASPSLDSQIVRQLNSGDVYIIVSEHDDFYAVSAPRDLKAYVHRKFVLDGEIEGTRVNVRLKPTVDSPVIAQLNTGDKAQGEISRENSKWLEINAPENTKFWVYRDYIENIGGPEIYLRMEKRRQKIDEILKSATETIAAEIQKPFADISIDRPLNELNQIAKETEDFPYYAEEAKKLLSKTSKQYLQKKIAYLESLTENSSDIWKRKNQQLHDEIQMQYAKIDNAENSYSAEPMMEPVQTNAYATPEMQSWEPREAEIYESWALNQNESVDFNTFYNQQGRKAVTLQGILSPYHQSVKNRPGDYLLVNEGTNLPIAYLYSTKVNLQNYIGKKVNVRAAERPNNNFAFPAYYILSLSED